MMDTTLIIPAQLKSVRFPNKLLHPIWGKPLIVNVIERVCGSNVSEIIVATDSEIIRDVIHAETDIRVVMTQGNHTCGTDRIAEVAAAIETDFILNVQGDELITGPEMVNEILLHANDELRIATLYTDLNHSENVNDTSIVKVRTNEHEKMIYMSRSPIPYIRKEYPDVANFFKQVGLYLFQREELLAFSKLKPTQLEAMEGIELLRALDCGMPLKGIYTSRPTADVNMPSDIETAESYVQAHPIKEARE